MYVYIYIYITCIYIYIYINNLGDAVLLEGRAPASDGGGGALGQGLASAEKNGQCPDHPNFVYT